MREYQQHKPVNKSVQHQVDAAQKPVNKSVQHQLDAAQKTCKEKCALST